MHHPYRNLDGNVSECEHCGADHEEERKKEFPFKLRADHIRTMDDVREIFTGMDLRVNATEAERLKNKGKGYLVEWDGVL